MDQPRVIAAGWYADSDDPTSVRYWNGTGWTEHRAAMQPQPVKSAPSFPPPAPHALVQPSGPTDQSVEVAANCPYCLLEINPKALRCTHCSGQLWFCKRCHTNVGAVGQPQQTNTKLLNPTYRTKYRCMNCRKTVGYGP